jgi:hypothetical protein
VEPHCGTRPRCGRRWFRRAGAVGLHPLHCAPCSPHCRP